MKRVLIGISLAAMTVAAYAGPASTFSGAINGYDGFMITDADASGSDCETLTTSIKVPGSKKDLLIGVSLQSGIMTKTKVKGQKGSSELASASGSVKVSVQIDGQEIAPGEVTFNHREQELAATFGGVLESCSFGCTTDLDTGETTCSFTKDNCLWTDEDISLMLSTTSANHFNFIAPNVGVGEHEVAVCVGLAAEVNANDLGDYDGYGTAESYAVANLGSLTVEVVRAANTDTGIEIDP